MTRAEKKEEIKNLKRSVSSTKSQLIHICNLMEEVSAPEARKLGNIIGRLEDWQNR